MSFPTERSYRVATEIDPLRPFRDPSSTADTAAGQRYFRGACESLTLDMLSMLPPGPEADQAIAAIRLAALWSCEALRLAYVTDDPADALLVP